MPRTDLSALLQKIDTDDVERVQPRVDTEVRPELSGGTDSVSATEMDKPEDEFAQPQKTRRPQAKVTPSATEPAVSPTADAPLYLRLVRKETRLREEQYETLTEYARKLNRAKTPKAGERITENTLIRIAIDLLIPQLDDLHGNDETQLRNSVSPRV